MDYNDNIKAYYYTVSNEIEFIDNSADLPFSKDNHMYFRNIFELIQLLKSDNRLYKTLFELMKQDIEEK